HRELVDPSRLERLGHLRVGPEGSSALLEDEVVAHAAGRGCPDTSDVLRTRRLEVEVPRALVVAPLEQVDEHERALDVAGTEAQVLVELRAVLAVEVDVEQLAAPQ